MYPQLKDIVQLKPTVWLNPHQTSIEEETSELPLNKQDIEDAASLWRRFAPFFEKEFPETRDLHGIIESPLTKIDHMKDKLNKIQSSSLEGSLYLKEDNALSIAGSIKARGGFFEVLHYAEVLALDAKMISKNDDYEAFSSEKFTSFFSQYTIGVASTGNLGLSIGIMSAKLGFTVHVYMSQDAKAWKKKLLREKGATVHEIAGDFSDAIKAAREETQQDPKGYFVDDEDSKYLFLGYSTAALRLKEQLGEANVKVDAENQLFVYLPCGVGGSPGGITFGLKQVFGEHVHCFFAEPTHSPSNVIGLLTGEQDKVSVQDFGLDNRTEADGLAVGRPSKFASMFNEKLVSGIYTVEDETLYKLLTMLADEEGIYIEPSATAGLLGPDRILTSDYIKKNSLENKEITHIAWSTGGDLVPEADRKEFYKKGQHYLSE